MSASTESLSIDLAADEILLCSPRRPVAVQPILAGSKRVIEFIHPGATFNNSALVIIAFPITGPAIDPFSAERLRQAFSN